MRGGTAGRDAPTGYPLLGHPSRSPEKFFCDGRPIHTWNGATGFCTFFWFRGGTPPQTPKIGKIQFFSLFTVFPKNRRFFSINFYQNLSGARLFFQKSFQLFSRENFSHSAWSRREILSLFSTFQGSKKSAFFSRCALLSKNVGSSCRDFANLRSLAVSFSRFPFASFWVMFSRSIISMIDIPMYDFLVTSLRKANQENSLHYITPSC